MDRRFVPSLTAGCNDDRDRNLNLTSLFMGFVLVELTIHSAQEMHVILIINRTNIRGPSLGRLTGRLTSILNLQWRSAESRLYMRCGTQHETMGSFLTATPVPLN